MSAKAAQPTSRKLALIAAAANLTVCGLVATTVLLTSGKPDSLAVSAPPESSAQPVSPAPETTRQAQAGSTTTTATDSASAIPPGMRPVSGPADIRTVVPTDWPVTRLSEPGSMQATDPFDSDRLLKFGGAEPDQPSEIFDYHLDYESKIAKRPGYTRLELTETRLRGFAAVAWEFEWNAPEGRRHVRSMYWRSTGIEYFVYAAAPAAKWPETLPIITAMIDNSTP
ncbi:hypothetical protein [Amycolatopsis nigrescens]|uniref:hypothetical protein n=1 Tax=Amycolatopsis nigrescens TaxID=381445 RepID=UPI0003827916|nr:hypothetical protein [Amycolatopsis nigrescens]